ncbi:LysR substrate-binding domain-containing protein [Chitinophaga sp. Hz27]|uniref:LysR substrate-binding domain-containing protein n=1 Tax=Chitinophaga sp. Hz27 TaxID=3347169 RepID=UPI0035D5AFBD
MMSKNANFGWNDANNASIGMTIQQIEYFLQLSDELHYWRTSYKVNITQSVLSRQIKALEDELQLTLFKRSNRKVELTPAGKFLQQQWKPLIDELNAAALYARKIHEGAGGHIVINHPGSISYDILPDMLARVAAEFPEIKVELVQIRHSQETEMLKAFKIDICYSRHKHEDELLTSTLIRHDNLALMVPSAHPIVTAADISTASLQNERFILSTFTEGETFGMKMDEVFAAYNIDPAIRFESDFGSVIMSLVKKGLGISVIPYSYSLANFPGVRFIPLPFEVPLYLIWRKNEENEVIKNVLNILI